ncbi:DUF4129 domain-containing protein [Pseudomonas sp. R1-18]|uniref:DUF4129 domain-containing protein n=1 Tax=Pseudomonas sp. R1-18 TaxID=1632772 RepID=UPI003DAA1DBA
MRLTEATVELRPRTPWEAIDLGVLLAREHRTLLMTSWAIVTLPIFVVLSLVFHNQPYLAILLFWWLKPLFERLPLLILSQALFGSVPTLKQALKAWPGTLRSQLVPSLLWRRLSLSRSFLLPVQQLENLSGAPRALRVQTLSRTDLRAARLLTLVGVHLEAALWIGLSVLLYALIPQQLETEWLWRNLLSTEVDANPIDHLTNAFYALVLIVWEPVYVACGFSLYLNRRTVLEAWDIELIFRRLRQRLVGTAYALLLGSFLLIVPATTPAWADSGDLSCPIPEPEPEPRTANDTQAAPDAPRLTHQALTSEAAQQAIKDLLQQPPFRNLKQVSGWRFPEQVNPQDKTSASQAGSSLVRWLNGLMETAQVVTRSFEVLLWAAVIGLSGWVAWRYRQWFAAFVSPRTRPAKASRDTPTQLFGLQVGVQTLPPDIAGSVERMWASQPREALALLYRALLNRLLTEHQLPLKNADTEGEVLQRVAQLNQPALTAFTRELTGHWQNLAYGHRLPPAASQGELCDGWRRLFDAEATR